MSLAKRSIHTSPSRFSATESFSSVPVPCAPSPDPGIIPYQIHGVDLKAAEHLVRRLLLHKALVPTYSLTPSLSSSISPALLRLLRDPEQPFETVVHPAVDPGWRAHEATNPSGVPPKRAVRKRLQIVAVLGALLPLLANEQYRASPLTIYDFCGGCGHIGITIAALFPEVQVGIVDRAEKALLIAQSRYRAAGLSNVFTLHCNVEDLPPERDTFDIAIALHACGPASDAVLSQAARCSAAIIVVPCCVGAVCNADIRTRPVIKINSDNSPESNFVHPARSLTFANVLDSSEYLLLARAADFSEENVLKRDQWRGIAKALVEHDRLLFLRDAGYDNIRLVKMRPIQCTPKNDILVAWRGNDSQVVEKNILGNRQAADLWPIDHVSNGVFSDFADASVLNGLGEDDVNAVEEVLRKVVCAPGSLGFYESIAGTGPRARKVIHAVAHSLALSHKSVGKGVDRRVVVTRCEFWPLYFEYYVAVGGPFVDATARDILSYGVVPKACMERRDFVRGSAHHITLVSPQEVSMMATKMKTDRLFCLKKFYDELFGTSFGVVGIGRAECSGKQGHNSCARNNGIDAETETTYFAVVEWPEAQVFRQKLGLPPAHFHITLGFRDKDIHGVAKDFTTIIQPLGLTCSPWLTK